MQPGKAHTQTLQALIYKEADVNARGKYGLTALMYAAKNGHRGTFRALINKGADANARDDFGRTALEYAAGYGHTGILALIKVKEVNK